MYTRNVITQLFAILGVFRRPRLVNATGSFTENFSNSSMNAQNVDEKDHYNRQINQDNESQGK